MRYAGETAYVLHARPWRESSLLVDLLTRAHGRIGMIARGVRGPRRQAQLAALQPLQHVRFDGVQRGELGYLSSVEALDAPPLLAGHASLAAAFYVNELVLRLAPGHDPHPELYALYAQVRARLHDAADLAWTLRRFERDLLQALGVGFDPGVDGDGAPIDPAARYRLEAEHGPRRVLGSAARSRQRHATGSRCWRWPRTCVPIPRPRQPAPCDAHGDRAARASAPPAAGRGLAHVDPRPGQDDDSVS